MAMIYLDNAATTPLCAEAREAMMPYLEEGFGNASALYDAGMRAKRAIDGARKQTAAVIGARPGEIYFTSCGTESDNWVLNAIAYANRPSCHIVTTAIEHHAVENTCRFLETLGVEVTYVKPDPNGIISADKVAAAIRPDTKLISVMAANNEIGTIEPLGQIGEVASSHGILFHTDAVQAFGHEPLDVDAMHIDYLSASAHKLGGPKGVGLLFMRKGKSLQPFLHGGAQERGRRAGTENVAGIVGFGAAAEHAAATMDEVRAAERVVRDHLISRLTSEVPGCTLNGDPERRLANNVNVLIDGIEGSQLVAMLNRDGIAASSASACASGAPEPSHVLMALGLSHARAFGSLRLTLGPETTIDDADTAVESVKRNVEALRD